MDTPHRDGSIRGGDTAILFAMTTTCMITITANIIVIATIALNRKLHSVSSALVGNMAACDLGVALTAMPLTIAGLVKGRWIYSEIACQMTAVLSSIFLIGSIWSLAIIALDRYLAINYCLRYSTWSPKKYSCILLSGIWIHALVFGLSPLFSWGGFEIQNGGFSCVISWKDNLHYGIAVCLLVHVAPGLIIGGSYLKMIAVARQHAKRIGEAQHGDVNHVSTTGAVAAGAMFSVRRLSMLSFAGNVDVKSDCGSFCDDYNDSMSSSESTSSIRRDVRATIRLLTLVLIYILTWLPVVSLNIHNSIQGHRLNSYVETLAYCLALCNSALNPFLYALLSKHFRKASIKLLKRRKTNSVVDISNKNHECVTSYAAFLRNLSTGNKTPSSHEHVLGSPETSSTFSESRPSSVLSDGSKRRFLEVPRNSFGDAFGFLIPNAVHENDENRLGSGLKHLRAKPRLPSTEIGEDVYDKKNNAKIQIKLDLVPN